MITGQPQASPSASPVATLYLISAEWVRVFRIYNIHSPVFYEHRGCQGGQVFSSHQLQHQWMGLWVEAAGLGGQQARLGSVAEQVW